MAIKSTNKRGKKATSFRIGRVRAFLRGRVWYLYYHEHGRRRQPRVGPDRDLARQMAAETNAQLESGMPSSLGFEPVSIPELRQRQPPVSYAPLPADLGRSLSRGTETAAPHWQETSPPADAAVTGISRPQVHVT